MSSEVEALLQEMDVLWKIKLESNYETMLFAARILGWERDVCLKKGMAQLWHGGPSWRGVVVCESMHELRLAMKKEGLYV